MQTVINDNPVWITHRTLGDISMEEFMENHGYQMDVLMADGDPETLFSELMETSGWYFATCSPGCLPDSSFFGPYATEEEALREAEKFYAE